MLSSSLKKSVIGIGVAVMVFELFKAFVVKCFDIWVIDRVLFGVKGVKDNRIGNEFMDIEFEGICGIINGYNMINIVIVLVMVKGIGCKCMDF